MGSNAFQPATDNAEKKHDIINIFTFVSTSQKKNTAIADKTIDKALKKETLIKLYTYPVGKIAEKYSAVGVYFDNMALYFSN